MKTHTPIDKSTWGDGPWQTEPDRVEWSHAGLPCLALRSHHGNWCGYAAVPPGHPLHGKPYQETPEALEVHGGLTYSDKCFGEICHVPPPGEPDDVWWFGFDCAHCWDLMPAMAARLRDYLTDIFDGDDPMASYKTLDYVQQETNRLAEQLRAADAVREDTAVHEESQCRSPSRPAALAGWPLRTIQPRQFVQGSSSVGDRRAHSNCGQARFDTRDSNGSNRPRPTRRDSRTEGRMKLWIVFGIAGLYLTALQPGVGARLGKWRKLAADWQGVANRWRHQYERQAGIAERPPKPSAAGFGLDITIHEKADGVDIFVTHPPPEGQETRH